MAHPPPPPRAYVRAMSTARRLRRFAWAALVCAVLLPVLTVTAAAAVTAAGLANSQRTAAWAGRVSCPTLLVMVIVAVGCEFGARSARGRAESVMDHRRARAAAGRPRRRRR